MSQSEQKILILSVSAGTGHRRAAEALRAAFLAKHSAIDVTILDTFKYTSPIMEKLVLGTYLEMLKFTPALYNYLYSRSEKGQPLSGHAKTEFNKLLCKFSASRLARFIEQYKPDVIICTHPFPLGLLSSLRISGDYSCFTVAAVTDFTIHPFWVFPEVDLYLVGADGLIDDLIGFDISEDKICAAGIPIDPVFAKTIDRKTLLEKYCLKPDQATILIMGGGMGMGPLLEAVEALGNLSHDCQIIVVTGDNTQLKRKMEQMVSHLANPVCVLGYVHNVHELMASSDLLVSKAGGLSCAEALVSGVPLFILNALPGQEQRNSSFLCERGVALEVHRISDLAGKIAHCLEHFSILEKMSQAAYRMSKPDAAKTAVERINQRLERYNTDLFVKKRDL